MNIIRLTMLVTTINYEFLGYTTALISEFI